MSLILADNFRLSMSIMQKIYEVNPFICPKCQGRMRILAFIEDEEVTRLPRLSMT